MSCHALGTSAHKFKCVDCHQEIKRRLLANTGLHASMLDHNLRADCTRCHSEHNGLEFVPTRWDVSKEEFDHNKTGYPLEGKHRGIACERCHNPRHIAVVERRRIAVKDMRRTFLGLSRQCLSCHEDEHHGQFVRCETCHTVNAWKPATGFQHATAKFQLTGAHEKVACLKCHLRADGPVAFVKYTGLSFQLCTDCHKDPHRGAFVATCQSCHSTASWRPEQLTSGFDHARTKFALLGKHQGLACRRCHQGADFKQPVAFAQCRDCHTKDPHQGQFAARHQGSDCAGCHVVEGWRPTTYAVREHQSSPYPLEGRHADVPCAKCHLPAGAATVYRVRHERCTDCHNDVHHGEFAAPPHENRCEDCHTVGGFRPSTFTLTEHIRTRFTLEGAHRAAACTQCHEPEGHVAGQAGRYRMEDRTCTGCHRDPHDGQFRARMLRVAAGGAAAGCRACHTLRSWRDLSPFDHSTTSFQLVGAHRSVTCERCHVPPLVAGAPVRVTRFQQAPTECGECHEDVHAGQFSGNGRPPDCARCHTVLVWKPSRFVHNRDSDFHLTGAHIGVACGPCHKTTRVIAGKPVLFYKPTLRGCADCHGPEFVN